MPQNWTITVGNPVLTAGMSFQVRYRKTTEQNWTNFLPNPTTNTFTISNLDNNADYEAEISTVCVNGDISTPVYHNSAPIVKCITPTLKVTIDKNIVTYNWNNNGFNYGTSGNTMVQISYDGSNWITLATVNPILGTYVYTMQSLPLNGMLVYYRLISSGNGCSQDSNIVSMTWSGSSNNNPIKDSYVETINTICRKTSIIAWRVICIGSKVVNFQNLLGVQGFVKMTSTGNNGSVNIHNLSPNTVIDANTDVPFYINANSYNMSSGGPAQLSNTNYMEATYVFAYSADGSTNWQPFNLVIKGQ
ncbi:hypothetical protein ACFQO9_11305 [Chryseobacterium zhengzhouense]|uniref:Fibronectin type-III domain-containing protein n=1 Tax=Chryseobacterium zhengzhouense TaxID=1636086 RepID=A0ABW2LZJ4_9FLAO